MSNKDLFKEAIADAKAVREAALANAKVALEEALAPKLQSMLSAKLQEMDMDDEDLEEVDHSSDNYSTSDDWHQKAHERSQADAIGEAELEEDFDLSSILAELSEEETSEPYTDEHPHDDIKGTEKGWKNGKKDEPGTEKGYVAEAEDEEAGEEEEVEDEESEIEPTEEPGEESEDEGENITDLTMDELKDIIKDIISAEMGGDEMGADDMEAGGEEEMAINLDGEAGDEEVSISDEEEIDEEIDLEELLAELDALGEGDDKEDEAMYEAKKKAKKDDKEDKEEMKEAIDTIEALRNELNEVNLLNAKLLYVNKIFKAKNLNESQKLKVIAQFDKANTAKEAKAIFESMNNAIAKSAKSTIKESLGFASKAAGVAPKKPIVDETMSRWQMLAGITKY
jgi:hypothetical protein